MNIYELITSSDPITFKAPNDKVAFFCALYLGKGKAGCNCCVPPSDTEIPSMIFFAKEGEVEKIINDFLGMSLGGFLKQNRPVIIEAFRSFAYGDCNSRIQYDYALEAITDPEKLKEFKAKHEDLNRTSLSKWVKTAWAYADNLEKQEVPI